MCDAASVGTAAMKYMRLLFTHPMQGARLMHYHDSAVQTYQALTTGFAPDA
jgi:hypothetical protein